MTRNRWYEVEAAFVDFTYKPSAHKDVRSCRVKSVKTSRSVSPHQGIGGNRNATPGDEKVRKQPCSLFPVSCQGASSSRVQMRGHHWNRGGEVSAWRPGVSPAAPLTESSTVWHVPGCNDTGCQCLGGLFYMLSFPPLASH